MRRRKCSPILRKWMSSGRYPESLCDWILPSEPDLGRKRPHNHPDVRKKQIFLGDRDVHGNEIPVGSQLLPGCKGDGPSAFQSPQITPQVVHLCTNGHFQPSLKTHDMLLAESFVGFGLSINLSQANVFVLA